MLLTVLAVIALGVGTVESQSDVISTAFQQTEQSTVVQAQKVAEPAVSPFLDILWPCLPVPPRRGAGSHPPRRPGPADSPLTFLSCFKGRVQKSMQAPAPG